MGRDILGIINNRNIHVYCVTGIDVYLADGSKDTTFQGYTKPDVDPITGQTVISIYMTETMSGVAWAGLLAHEISHIINPHNNLLTEELNAYNLQIQVLNQLYHSDDAACSTDAKKVLDSFAFDFPFPIVRYNPRSNEYIFVRSNFPSWISTKPGYSGKPILYDPHSPLGFTIRKDRLGRIWFDFDVCDPQQCTCKCHDMK